MNEADTCRTYILPKLKTSGWDDDYISEQLVLTPGRIKPLEGDKKRLWRYREGDYRIVPYPDKETNNVTFMDVYSRGEIYKK